MNFRKFLLNIIIFILFLALYQFLIFVYSSGVFFYKYFFVKERNLPELYGKNSYAIITGGSSGQGKQIALNLAQRGFNIFLIGSQRSENTIQEINEKYPEIKTELIVKDFRKSFEKDFFSDIEEKINKLDGNISMLVNNVAHRTAWDPYHKMPVKLIKDTISCGTLVQAQLTHMIIPFFLKRSNKSAIINITAQCNHPNFGPGMILSNDISVPYLSVYEASNAFGYYHSNSIHKEYKNKIDIQTTFVKKYLFNLKDFKTKFISFIYDLFKIRSALVIIIDRHF